MAKNYIDNKRFEILILEYVEDPENYSEELITMFDLLIDNIIVSFKFRVDKDDAKQECFVVVLKVMKNFHPSKGKAFNYFTTVIANHLRYLYTKDKKYAEKIKDYQALFIDQSPKNL